MKLFKLYHKFDKIQMVLLECVLKIIPANCTTHFKLLGLLTSRMMRIIHPKFNQHSPERALNPHALAPFNK